MLEISLMIAILGWGIAGIFGGRAARATSQISLLFWGPIISFPLIVVPILFGATWSPPAELLLFAGASSLALFIAWAFYIAALQRGETSPVVAIGSAYPLFALFIFFLSGKETSALVVLGAFLVATGLVILQRPGGDVSKHALFLGISAAALWGFWGFFDYQALQWGSAWDLMMWTFLFALVCSFALGSYITVFKNPGMLRIQRMGFLYRLATSISSTIAVLAFYWALQEAPNPTTVIALTASYPLITILIAVAIKEEKFYPQRLLATCVIIAGIITLYM